MVTLSRLGKFNFISHFDISGNWLFRIRMVLLDAVAVMRSSLPPILVSSPVDSAIVGRKAFVVLPFIPQLTTAIVQVSDNIQKNAIVYEAEACIHIQKLFSASTL